jgi:hypothetical protein
MRDVVLNIEHMHDHAAGNLDDACITIETKAKKKNIHL